MPTKNRVEIQYVMFGAIHDSRLKARPKKTFLIKNLRRLTRCHSNPWISLRHNLGPSVNKIAALPKSIKNFNISEGIRETDPSFHRIDGLGKITQNSSLPLGYTGREFVIARNEIPRPAGKQSPNP